MKIYTKHVSRLAVIAISGVVVAMSVPASASESSWPQRPVTIVVPFPPGGMTDVIARRLAQDMQQQVGQTIVVENRAGASGQIGTEYVARAKPDGYTLLVSATHHVINPAVRSHLPYDASKDFTPLALMATTPNLLVVNKDLPVSNVQEFIEWGKKEPGGVMFGSSSIGGATHLSGEMFKLETGLTMTNVPYKGAAPALTDLLGGQIPALFHDVATMAPYVRDNRVKALGVTSKTRSPALPDVPTIAEQGIPGYEAITWIGFYGPAGMPADVAEKLNTIAQASMNSDKARPWFEQNGTEPGQMNLVEYKAFVDNELVKWKDVVTRAGVKVE
ncbi:tripartite tricarboxylate transporter substrate binding protein [Alcaligenaceae bacterium]|nr:tripartite tricarboxylate transporter substrate binding protein [Alcaligenaceae bacterium]